MQEIVANVNNVKFEIEIALETQLGAQPLPFPGMDKSGSAVCTFYLYSRCDKENACPFRHIKGDRTVVCKHWLRGLCKKGDDCEFLHEYDMSKMPECYFFSKFGQCGNKECPFLHIDPEKKLKDCPWYDRGFCRHGPHCKNRHVRRVMCQNYLCGFCLDGPDCKYIHVKYDVPPVDTSLGPAKKMMNITCHICHEQGHKSYNCPKNNSPASNPYQRNTSNISLAGYSGGNRPLTTGNVTSVPLSTNYSHHHNLQDNKRSIDSVVCFKCNELGHYANKCPKGHLAFLSSAHNTADNHMEH